MSQENNNENKITPLTGVREETSLPTNAKTSFFKSRKFKMGTFATLTTLFVVIIVVIINVVTSILSSRFDLKLDMTRNNFYQISQELKDVANSLPADVKITVLSTKEEFESGSQYFKGAVTTLETLTTLNQKIKLDFIDIEKSPTFAQNYAEYDIAPNDIIVESGERVRVLDIYDIFNIETSMYGTSIKSSKMEQTIATAMIGVTAENGAKASVTTSHNEADIQALSELLFANNIEMEELSLVTGEIDESINMIIIPAPTTDFTPDEITKLDRFLSSDKNNNRTVLYIADTSQPVLENLSAFLKNWGIEQEKGYVYETDTNRVAEVNNPLVSLVDFAEQELSAKYTEKNQFLIMSYSVPMKLLFDQRNNITTKVYVQYPQTAKAFYPNEDGSNMPSETDPNGPYPAIVGSTKTRSTGAEFINSNVVAISGIQSISSRMMSSATIANSAYIIDVVNGVLGRSDQTITIVPKEVEAPRIQISQSVALFLGISFAFVIPAGILILGIVVWVRRRKR